jgi:hypothetical protein
MGDTAWPHLLVELRLGEGAGSRSAMILSHSKLCVYLTVIRDTRRYVEAGSPWRLVQGASCPTPNT